MTDLTMLGIAAIRDGVRDGQFKAREVAEAFNAKRPVAFITSPTHRPPSHRRSAAPSFARNYSRQPRKRRASSKSR